MVQRRESERQATKAVTGFVSEAAYVTLSDGLILYAPGGDAAVVDPILEDRYELNELDFVRAAVRAGDAVLDLGAHVGAYALRLAKLVGPTGRVTAIEASRTHVEWLRRSVEANRFHSWTDVVHAAASDVSGTAWIRHPAEGSTAHCWLAENDAGDAEPVRTIRLDELVSGALQFVKVDIEGAEGRALRGAERVLKQSRPTLLVELHPHLLPIVSGESADSLIAWVVARGYECRLLGAGRPGETIRDTPSNAVTTAVFLPK